MNSSEAALQERVSPMRAVRVKGDRATLLRQFLGDLGVDDWPAAGSPDEAGAAVMLDVEVDGWHYRLTRCAIQALPATSLSPREAEIVHLVARGLPSKAIASALDISLWTVSTHLRRLFLKLGVSSRAELVARVMAKELLEGSR